MSQFTPIFTVEEFLSFQTLIAFMHWHEIAYNAKERKTQFSNNHATYQDILHQKSL